MIKSIGKSKSKKIFLVSLLTLVMFACISISSFAASDSTRNPSGYSYTRWVGPAATSRYHFVIDGKSYSGVKKNTVEFKDPIVPREGLVVYLKHGQEKSGRYENGSSSAYHRGYVQYGYVSIKA